MKKRFFSFMRFFRKDCLCHLILLSVLIGIIVGLISVVFHFSLSFLDNNIFRGITGFVETTSQRVKFDSERIIDFGVYRPWLLPVVIGLGALIAGIIVANFAPDTRGHGTDQALKAYHHKNGIIAPKVPVIKTIASVITLGFGGSGGAEGPMVQSGAGVGSFIARLLKLSVRERRILLISGMAAGLGSFFKAPIAGAIFSNEILYRDGNFEDDALVPATIASVIGYITYSFFYGFSPLFQTEQTMFIMYWHYLIPLTILALVCSAFGSFFVKTFYKIHDIFEKLSLPLWLKPAIGGVLTGLLAIFIPYVAGSSYGYLQGVFVNELSLTILILLAFGKVIATSFSIGSGGSGGVFGPSMVIGGALGGAVGIIYNMAANGQYAVNPGTMGILGMAGFFTAVANTPISTLIMVSEMTGDFYLLIPGLWVIGLSYTFSRSYSIYREQITDSITSPAFRENFREKIISKHQLAEVMEEHFFLRDDFDVNELDIIRGRFKSNLIPVINEKGEYLGIINFEDPELKINKLPAFKSDFNCQKTREYMELSGNHIVAVVDNNGNFIGAVSDEIMDLYIFKKILAK